MKLFFHHGLTMGCSPKLLTWTSDLLITHWRWYSFHSCAFCRFGMMSLAETLGLQYWMDPDICLVNKRIYWGRLLNDQSTQNQTRDPNWDASLISWIPQSRLSNPIHPCLLFLNVTNGMKVCGQLSYSWSNIPNVNVVFSLLTKTKKFSTRSVCCDWRRV